MNAHPHGGADLSRRTEPASNDPLMTEITPQRSIIDSFDIESPAATEFRRLLHNINEIAAKGATSDPADPLGLPSQRKVFMITSAIVGEGKSTIAAYLALTASRLKKRRTLLIDCDLRRPTIHHLFSVARNPGLAEALTDRLPAKSVLRRTALETLDIITAGKPTQRPTDIFDPVAIRKIIDEIVHEYDLVLVDAPPLLPVSDPMLLMDAMDGALLVIKAGETQREIVTRAVALLGGTKKLMGVALNNYNQSMPYYFDSYYYGYDEQKR